MSSMLWHYKMILTNHIDDDVREGERELCVSERNQHTSNISRICSLKTTNTYLYQR